MTPGGARRPAFLGTPPRRPFARLGGSARGTTKQKGEVLGLAGRVSTGDKLPFFLYDTPYSAQNRFRDLLSQCAPLVLVFMNNFGHPVTRTFADRYARTHDALHDGGFAMVVRSRADKLSRSIGPDTLPFPLLCDADGVLYDLLEIPQRTGTLTSYSLEAWQILREAKRNGYRPPKDMIQQLPLTLILDADGTVLFSHYGASLTDVPEDCEAMQALLEELDLVPGPGDDVLGEDGDVAIYTPAGESPRIPGLTDGGDTDTLDKTGVLRLFEDAYQND